MLTRIPAYVLDACAMIAVLNGEPGADVVEKLYEDAGDRRISLHMHRVNLFEVYYDAVRTAGQEQADKVLAAVRDSPIHVDDEISDRMFVVAARLKIEHKMSLADSIALANTSWWGGTLVTADHHELDALAGDCNDLSELHGGERIKFCWIR